MQVEDVPKLVAKIEKFFQVSPKSYRLSALYLIDSICKSKSEARKTYVERFSSRLPALMAIFLKDAAEKDQVRFLPSSCFYAILLPLF